MAPDRVSTPEREDAPDARDERLHVALIIPLDKFASFSKWVASNIRIIKPSGWGGEVVVSVLPDLGEDLVNFDQYGPPPTLIIEEVVPK
jgi:hypothetical protein